MTSDQNLLDRVRVASPCNARWEDMTGDDRSRFCKHCSKHVFNLSALSRAEAGSLVREKEGKFCARFYRRSDGRMLTGNCPVGQGIRRRRTFKFMAAVLGMMALMTTAIVAGVGPRNGPRGPFAQKLDGWIYDLKVRLGILKPPMLMGEIVLPIPPRPSPPSPPGGE